MAESKTTCVSDDNRNTYTAGPVIKTPVSNCREPVHEYWPRKKLDDEIRNIEKGKVKILPGTIGTGKTSATLHYIVLNKQKFAISWVVYVSTGGDSTTESLTQLGKKLGVSYRDLFETIEQKAKHEDIIFFLDNVERKPLFKWFEQLWNIRSSIYIIVTTNNPSLDLPNVEKPDQLLVERFDEALDYLKGIHAQNSENDLQEICKYFGWNILGLSAAKHYMLSNKINIGKYLEMLRDKVAANKVHLAELDNRDRILYESVRACLEAVGDKFDAIAATSLLSNNIIPDFLLSNLLHSSNHLENQADINNLPGEIKSLVRITEENGIRLFSFHSFTQHVIREMTTESKKAELLYKLAGIFMRHISKDNRFTRNNFLQRTIREHAEVFLQKWEDKPKDDPTLIALTWLSELVGFAYTQQQPVLVHEVDVHLKRARKILHELCKIAQEDLQPAVGFQKFLDYSEDRNRELYDISDKHLAVAHQLFEKLSEKSSELPSRTIEEFVFLRTVNKQDLSLFPEVVKENQTVKKKFDFAELLSPSDVSVLVGHGVAYSVDQYRLLFLPELYLKVIYTLGRNYFDIDITNVKISSFYIDLLKLAYCLSREISKRMNSQDAVLHELLVQKNALLYLLVNNDQINQHGKYVMKETQVHARDLKKAIDRYKQLVCDERNFFELGMLKRTKDDTYSKLDCYVHILTCYKQLLSLKCIRDDEQYIAKGVQCCYDILRLLDIYAAKDTSVKEEDLVLYSRHMNAIAGFFLSINRKEYYFKVINIFATSALHAEKHNLALDHLEALVGLADVFSRIGRDAYTYKPRLGQCSLLPTKISIRYIERCNREKSLLEVRHQKPNISDKIRKIQKQNYLLALQCYFRRDDTINLFFSDESDVVPSVSSNSPSNGVVGDDGASDQTPVGVAEGILDEEISADAATGVISSTEESNDGRATSKTEDMRTRENLCRIFEIQIEKRFLEKLQINRNELVSPSPGRFPSGLSDAGTVTSIILGAATGTTIVLGVESFGIGSFVGAAMLGVTFTVTKVDKRIKKSKAKKLNGKVQIYLHSRLRCIIMDVARELSRMFESQVVELGSEPQIGALAECAVNLMLQLKNDDKLDRNTLLKKVLQDAKVDKTELLTRNGNKWFDLDVFRKPGLRKVIFENDSARFEYYVKPTEGSKKDACDTEKYGYRGQFLEMKSDKEDKEKEVPKKRDGIKCFFGFLSKAKNEADNREDACDCKISCTENHENCTIDHQFFCESEIDSRYKEPQTPIRVYTPIHILVQCPNVLVAFIYPLQNQNQKPSLANFLRKMLHLPDDHLVLPVYRAHSAKKILDLRNSDLTGSDLTHSDFTVSVLEECNFTNVVMLFTKLARARMSRSTFCKTLISHSILAETIAENCEWVATELCYSRVEGAKLRQRSAEFGCTLVETNIEEAEL